MLGDSQSEGQASNDGSGHCEEEWAICVKGFRRQLPPGRLC